MKKMNIRQAHDRMKKMFPGNYVATKKELTCFESERNGATFRVYTNSPKPTGADSENSFEEAIEKLKEKIEGLHDQS